MKRGGQEARRARRAGAAFARLVRLMARLRAPDGCPWDREQTHATLRAYLLEETYEALDAIDRGDLDALCGELGDVLLQCVFHAQLAAETRRFDIVQAVDAIHDKLVRRHPHVFTATGRPLSRVARARQRGRVGTAGAVLEQWEQIKSRERAGSAPASAGHNQPGVLSGIPAALPALLAAHEIGTRVAAVGFDWPRAADVVDKIDEEVRELRQAIQTIDEAPEQAADELGDVLFSIANLARKLGIEPESALRAANAKFSRRFAGVEAALGAAGRTVHGASLDELEAAWQRVKTRAAATAPSTSARRRPTRRRSRTRRSRS